MENPEDGLVFARVNCKFIWIMTVYICHTWTNGVGGIKKRDAFIYGLN